MDFIRSWIFSVTVSAMIVAVAEAVMPKGAASKASRLLFGLVLMLGILQPIVRLDYDDLFVLANGISEVTVECQEKEIENNTVWMKSIIEEELSAYVLDKAKNVAPSCQVSVFCEEGENGTVEPYSVQVKGSLNEEEKNEMRKLIRDDLGISDEYQEYIDEELP